MTTGVFTQDGATTVVEHGCTDAQSGNGVFALYGSGNFGGGKLYVDISPDGTTYFPYDEDNSCLTATGYIMIPYLKAASIRVRLKGSSNPNLTWWTL